ncbi:MAG: prepilin-type cleavage/methylation domain-containing protein [Selenomonadaceae bacterium]|nr:prepilin-type cleavage/methylation domain-containing protein [Selenomonadaceae bacterium]
MMGVSDLFGRLNERGFATLEVILMITVLGILSAVAIPRFTAITTSANTAKVQADLSTLDTAIALYQMDNGTPPTDLKNNLKDYVDNIEDLKPPSGNIYVNGEEKTASSYDLSDDKTRAVVLVNSTKYTSDSITKSKKTT